MPGKERVEGISVPIRFTHTPTSHLNLKFVA